MADGEHLLDEWISGTVATTDASVTPLCSVTAPTSSFNQMRVEGWIVAHEIDATLHEWYQEVVCVATYDAATGGNLSITSASTVVTHDPNTSGWTGATITEDGTDITLNVTGAGSTNIRWYGELKVKSIENSTLDFT